MTTEKTARLSKTVGVSARAVEGFTDAYPGKSAAEAEAQIRRLVGMLQVKQARVVLDMKTPTWHKGFALTFDWEGNVSSFHTDHTERDVDQVLDKVPSQYDAYCVVPTSTKVRADLTKLVTGLALVPTIQAANDAKDTFGVTRDELTASIRPLVAALAQTGEVHLTRSGHALVTDGELMVVVNVRKGIVECLKKGTPRMTQPKK